MYTGSRLCSRRLTHSLMHPLRERSGSPTLLSLPAAIFLSTLHSRRCGPFCDLVVMPCQAMSMVVVHVASGTRNILVFLGRMAEAMGHALQNDFDDAILEHHTAALK